MKQKQNFTDRLICHFEDGLKLKPQKVQENEYQYAKQICEWHKTALSIAMKIAERLMNNLGPAAFAGRKIEGKDKTSWYCCAPKAYNIFLYYIHGVYENRN